MKIGRWELRIYWTRWARPYHISSKDDALLVSDKDRNVVYDWARGIGPFQLSRRAKREKK